MICRCKNAFFLFLFIIFLIIACTYNAPEEDTPDTTVPYIPQDIPTTQSFLPYPVETGLFHTTLQVQESPYWSQIQDLLESYLPDDFTGKVNISECDTWLRLEPEYRTKYFSVTLYLNDPATQSNDLDFRYLRVNKHCCEQRGLFDFNIWVAKEDGKDILKTDFPQQLFSYLLVDCAYSYGVSKRDYINGDVIIYLAGFSPSYSDSTVPYYELWEEPLVLQGSPYESKSRAVFQEAYNKMHDWQSQITGDLTQNIRFCYDFFPEEEVVYLTPEIPVSDMNILEAANWEAASNIQGYHNWVDSFGPYFPVHRISFTEPYGPKQDTLFSTYLAELETYHSDGDINMTKMLDRYSYVIVIVGPGDTLWSLAEKYYGDGRYWQKIWQDNQDIIGNDINLIVPDMQLWLYPL